MNAHWQLGLVWYFFFLGDDLFIPGTFPPTSSFCCVCYGWLPLLPSSWASAGRTTIGGLGAINPKAIELCLHIWNWGLILCWVEGTALMGWQIIVLLLGLPKEELKSPGNLERMERNPCVHPWVRFYTKIWYCEQDWDGSGISKAAVKTWKGNSFPCHASLWPPTDPWDLIFNKSFEALLPWATAALESLEVSNVLLQKYQDHLLK